LTPFDERLDERVERVILDGDLDTHLLEQRDLMVDATKPVMLLLIGDRPHYVGAGQVREFRIPQRLFDGWQLLRLDDGDDELHGSMSDWATVNP
jgi:hypothetical protein